MNMSGESTEGGSIAKKQKRVIEILGGRRGLLNELGVEKGEKHKNEAGKKKAQEDIVSTGIEWVHDQREKRLGLTLGGGVGVILDQKLPREIVKGRLETRDSALVAERVSVAKEKVFAKKKVAQR